MLLSVLLHGSAIGLIVRRPQPAAGAAISPAPALGTLAPAAPAPAPPAAPSALDGTSKVPAADQDEAAIPERISIDEMQAMQSAGETPLILDVRTERTYEADPFIARGAVRIPPLDAVRLATAHRIPWKATLIAYCA